jgi:hypothetical protein
MTKQLASLTSMLVLVLGLATFAGSALAGNGNGSDQGAQADPAAAPVSQDGASGRSAGQGSADQNSPGVNGIKPTNGISKGTKCSTGGGTGSSATCAPTNENAAVASGAGNGDASKRYGNGKTAAQIANSRGAPAGTTIYGPGNSQPHKVEKCPGSGKFVDVHAVKSFSSSSCAEGSQPTTTPKAKPTSPTAPTVTTTVGVPSKAASPSVAAGIHGAGHTAAPRAAVPTGGVLGVTESAGSEPAGGVLGQIESLGTLPFTGFPLWATVALGLVLIALGAALRRRGRVTV